MFDSFWSLVTYDIGIDLGTTNSWVYVKGKGIVLNEPSVVAINTRNKQVLAVGRDAKKMLGRTPSSVSAIRPLRDGVISDFDITHAMIRYFIRKVHGMSSRFIKIPRPRVVVGVPSSVTEVERQAVVDAAKYAGAREVYVVEEPMAAAIGCKLPVQDACGSMIIDIGGGTSDIAIISLGSIVVDKTIRVAGDEMDENVTDYVRQKYNLLIGMRTAEEVKIKIGSAYPLKEEKSVTIQGRDLMTGLPKSVEVNSVEIREAIMSSIKIISDAAHDAIEAAPPELVSDLYANGIVLTGGGSLLEGFDKFFSEYLHIPVRIPESPMTSVVDGTAVMLDDLELLRKAQDSWADVI
ncbi:rod shape-determining protein [Candidatus Dojkabacteria bacterium]|nr:rod shape-determining protein [Candidatus Dojkabacteria bacterium]